MNNARKHAQAEQIVVRLYQHESNVVVEIEDNGVGFDVGAVDASYDQRGSLGMINMRERTELIEGTLRIHSAKGRGTKITILIPIHAAGELGDGQGDNSAAPLELHSQRTGIQRAAVAQDNPVSPAEPPASVSRPTRPQPLDRLASASANAQPPRTPRPSPGSPQRPSSSAQPSPPPPSLPRPKGTQPLDPLDETR